MRKNRWTANDSFRAVCPACRKVVESRFEYRTVRLGRTRLCVRDVLVDVCPTCDGTIYIPPQSLAQLREAGVAK